MRTVVVASVSLVVTVGLVSEVYAVVVEGDNMVLTLPVVTTVGEVSFVVLDEKTVSLVGIESVEVVEVEVVTVEGSVPFDVVLWEAFVDEVGLTCGAVTGFGTVEPVVGVPILTSGVVVDSSIVVVFPVVDVSGVLVTSVVSVSVEAGGDVAIGGVGE